jgi:membrane fusion protein, multidrug efflux system
MMKQAVWISLVVVVLCGLAYPKLKPLLHSDADKLQTATADVKAAGKAEGQNKEEGKKGEGGKKKDAPPLKVSTFVVTPAPFAETIASTGTLRADEGVELQAETNGKVVSINFAEGTPVRKGTLLVKLNDSDLRANVDRFTYSKQLAELRERRYSKLLAQKVVTQDEYDTALTDVNVQSANIDLYKAQIEKTEIRAPFDGVVGLRYVSTGAYVNAATKIATLQRVDKLKVDFSIPEKYSGRIKAGASIVFSVAGGLRKYTGIIFAIDPRIDSGTRTLMLRAVCPNADGSLLPGAFANVTVQLEKISDALLVPAEAVVPGLDEKNVFVIKDGKAERRVVETGSRTATEVHILTGLKPGDVLITSGLQQMRAGQAVVSLGDKSDKQDKKAGSESGGKKSDKPEVTSANPKSTQLAKTTASVGA